MAERTEPHRHRRLDVRDRSAVHGATTHACAVGAGDPAGLGAGIGSSGHGAARRRQRGEIGRRGGPVPRDDVALVLLETLLARSTTGLTFEVFAGDTPARDAVRNLASTPNVSPH